MTGEEGWRATAVAAAAVGVIVGARMADRRRRLRMARHQLWRRAALDERGRGWSAPTRSGGPVPQQGHGLIVTAVWCGLAGHALQGARH
jgi:hypothetical protein